MAVLAIERSALEEGVSPVICPPELSVRVRQSVSPTLIWLVTVPGAIVKVVPPMVIEPALEDVAGTRAVMSPQTVSVVEELAVIELGGMSWPEAFSVPFRQRFAPT